MVWQESDALVWNARVHELKTVVEYLECLPAEENDVGKTEMRSDELRDGFESEELEQRDRFVAEHAGHSKQDLERVIDVICSF